MVIKIVNQMKKKEIAKMDFLIEMITIPRDLFSKMEFEYWTRLYNNVSELISIIEGEFNKNQIEKNELFKGGKLIFEIKNEAKNFFKKCEERISLNKGWKGPLIQCAESFDKFRANIIPLFVSLASHMEKEHPYRLNIEEKLNLNNYPMLI